MMDKLDLSNNLTVYAVLKEMQTTEKQTVTGYCLAITVSVLLLGINSIILMKSGCLF